MSTAYGAFSAMFVSLCVLTAILFCLILCCDPPAEQGYNVAADAGGRRGRWPGAQWRRPAPVVVGKPHQLAYFSYPASAEADGDRGTAGASVVVCAICLEALVGGAECSEVPACRHVFHRGCLALWMKGSNTCPLCRLQEAYRAGVTDLALVLINPVIEPGEVLPNVNGIHLVIAGEFRDHHVVGVESTLHHPLALEDLLLHCFEPRLHATALP
ncbi:RING-H2 zinc finger protein RHA4a [Hordeum vulgare]|nr:RING-H2 zinc finger protein RHA4a [Hordeum vulgare]